MLFDSDCCTRKCNDGVDQCAQLSAHISAILHSIVVRTSASHAENPGSIPGGGVFSAMQCIFSLQNVALDGVVLFGERPKTPGDCVGFGQCANT